ncbi:hypothetical protein LJC15_00700, partial [Desulfovibrio sp. OttesenSCG-928-G11]|nr:hypothetical protein [Desulfovibrio sp. OttesenSCG-928-G11]
AISRCRSVALMDKKDLAKAIVAYAFRNGPLENIHAGAVPVSKTGDFSDVTVVDAAGNRLPWNDVSRISQAEMKAMMQTAVNRVYAALAHEGDAEFEKDVLAHALKLARGWDEPEEE